MFFFLSLLIIIILEGQHFATSRANAELKRLFLWCAQVEALFDGTFFYTQIKVNKYGTQPKIVQL